MIMPELHLYSVVKPPGFREVGVSRLIMCACILDFIQELHCLVGRSRLVGLHYRLGGPESANVRWGAVLPLSIACHPPAQATLPRNIGVWL